MASKLWVLIGTAFLLCCIGSEAHSEYFSATPTSRSIDDIVNESWNRLVSLGKINVKNEFQNSKNDKRLSSQHNHKHGECASDEWMKYQEAKLKDFYVPNSKPQDQDVPTTHSSSHKRSVQSMRFFVNTTVMASGRDPRACYNVGDSIYIRSGVVDYPYTCAAEDLLSTGLVELIQDSIIPTMLQIFSEVLSVKEPANPLKLDPSVWFSFGRQCDTDVPIPNTYCSVGINDTDYILFVTARPTLSQNTVAYAGGCNFNVFATGVYSRPYAGILNLNPRWFQSYVTSMSMFEYKNALKIAMHEVTHALGFSSYFYNSYVNSTGNFYSPAIWFTENVSGTAPSGNAYSNVTIQKLRTPNLLSFARDYFNCSSLDGVELEDYGGSGTAGSHWERRVCGEEYMTGFVSDQMWISGFTLSLFDDMGWYNVDKSKVEYIGWGKDQGCSFVQSRCETSWPSADPGYWCTSSVTGCTADRVGYGICGLVSSNQSAYYQHFANQYIGGRDLAADWCPYTYPDTSCRDTRQAARSAYFEIYGDDSRCWEVTNSGGTSFVCYPFQCATDSSNNTILQVEIDSNWITCPTNGGTVNVDSIFGGSTTVNCPETSLFCRVVDGFVPEVLITDTLLLSTPSRSPSSSPSRTPSATPSVSSSPSQTPSPSITPSPTTSATPSVTPTTSPSVTPSVTPTVTPSVTPTMTPFASASPTPSMTPTSSLSPSSTPSSSPSNVQNNIGSDSSSGMFTLQSTGFIVAIALVGAFIVVAVAGVITWGIRRNRQRSADELDLRTLWKALE